MNLKAMRPENVPRWGRIIVFGCQTALRRIGRHLLAALGTTQTSLDTIVHVAHPFAAGSARAADLGARFTDHGMMSRGASHEVRRCLADLRTVEHEPHVRWLAVLAAHFQAVRGGHLEAGHVALVTIFHALLLVGRH
jgi:hypothetical protein